jgi:hypothetical protein
MMKAWIFLCLAMLFGTGAKAQDHELLEELNPFDPGVENLLREYDRWYEEGTGLPSHIGDGDALMAAPRCYRASCPVWARVVKSQQRLYLYLNGSLSATWLVSTGMPGFTTPNFDRHPDGRIYERYSSRRYPGGDYMGLGNMPYAVFISGGFAIHGTPAANWPRLGSRASHGCIRLHPDYGRYFNRLVRANGIGRVWITVQ